MNHVSVARSDRPLIQYTSDIIRVMPDGCLLLDPDGQLRDVNPAYCRMVGYSEQELLAMNIGQLEYQGGDDGADVIRQIAEGDFGSANHVESQHVGSSGQIIDVELTVLPRETSGEPAILFVRDVTERKRRERTWRARAAALDSATDGIIICSAGDQTPMIYVNPATERITGYSTDELLGRNLSMLEGPDSDPAVSSLLQQSVRDGTGFAGEILHYRRDGETLWTRLRITPIYEDSGQLTYFAAILTDVTRARKADFALRESEAMLRSVTESATDFILLTDLDGDVLFINRTFPSQTVDKVVGTSIYDHIPTGSREAVREAHERVINTQQPDTYELAYRNDVDEVVLLESIVSPIVRFEEVIGLTISSRDVTAQRRMQRQLERSQRLASLGTLAGGIAHEINNPMAAAWTAADAAQRFLSMPDSDDMLAECLEAVGSSVQRCQVIIDNVLRVARRQTSLKAACDLNTVVQQVVASMEKSSPPGASFRVSLDSDLPACVINVHEIEQVLENLIRNALQSGTAVDVVVSTQSADDVVTVQVTDNGGGIAEADLKEIFDPFFTTRGGTDGTGLGLAICHAIIEDHGGMIDVESQLTQGTTVAVSLPLNAA